MPLSLYAFVLFISLAQSVSGAQFLITTFLLALSGAASVTAAFGTVLIF